MSRSGIAIVTAIMATAMPACAGGQPTGCPADTAHVQQLAKITNTRDGNYHCLAATVDDHANLLGFQFETHVAAPPNSETQAPPQVRIRDFEAAEIASEKGAVLDGTPGHDAVILHGNIAPGAAEPLAIRFLYNGITNEFHECPLELTRDPQLRWHLAVAADPDVKRVTVKTWGLPIVGTVGIETLEGLCPAD